MRSGPQQGPKTSPGTVWTLASAEVHCFSVPQVCDGGGALAPLYVWHKRAGVLQLSFPKGWPSHPAEGMQLAVKLEASSVSGLASCRAESGGMDKFSIGISPHPTAAPSAEVVRAGL